MAGAILGTCVGGPVGLLAGVKIGGLAAIGGSIFGESCGFLDSQ
jgi:syntaxin 17